MENKLVVFKGKEIRRALYNNEWWFSVVDVCEVLTGSADAGAYWRKLKQRLKAEGSEVVTFCHGLKLIAPDGKMRQTDSANTEGIFRIIQSIPSSKAEPFKRWLAKVGYERVQEIEDPELASKRTKAIYRAKGYSDVWIEKRMRGIAIRAELTDEWQKRGVKGEPEYAILTSEISKAAFGLTPSARLPLPRFPARRMPRALVKTKPRPARAARSQVTPGKSWKMRPETRWSDRKTI
ncbi:MAG: hypothetical protein SRB1_01596 [Desulfobacteraceae bacterium Eth-SRB1]|nr:MAG: hypothetical protein SRB1_01596 [Desulfobacteraceae bacterium Eth-SRB1]